MRKLLIGVVALVTVLGVGLVVFLATFDAARYKPQIQSALSTALGRKFEIGDLQFSLRRFALSANDIRIADSAGFGDEPFVSARQFAVSVALWPLLARKELQVRRIELIEPRIRLRQSRKGAWNFADLGAAEAAPSSVEIPSVRVDTLRITDGSVEVKLDDGSVSAFNNLDVAIDGLSTTAAFPLRLSAEGPGGAGIAVEAQIGPLRTGDALHTPLKADLRLRGFDLASSDPGADMAGRLDWQGTLNAANGGLDLDGEASIESLRLFPDAQAATVPVHFVHKTHYDLDRHTGALRDGRLSMGDALLAIAGKIDNRKQPMRVDFNLTGKAMAVDSLQALLPVFGIVLPENSQLSGGTLDLALRAHGPLDTLLIDGPVVMRSSALRGFSLGERMRVAMALTGLSAPADTLIEHARSELAVSAEGVRMQGIDALLTDIGSATGSGRIGADKSLDFDLRIVPSGKLAGAGTSSLASALQGALGRSSKSGIGLRIGGNTDAPTFKVETAAVAGAVLSGLIAGKTGDAEGAAQLDQSTLEQKAGDALLKGLFGKKKQKEGEKTDERN